MDIKVALDITAEQPVVVIPKHPHAKKGQQAIRWTPIGDTSFTFVSLTPLDNPNPFSNIVIAPQLITAQYNNTDSNEYKYTIGVLSGGSKYKSESIGNGGGPTIRNK